MRLHPMTDELTPAPSSTASLRTSRLRPWQEMDDATFAQIQADMMARKNGASSSSKPAPAAAKAKKEKK